MYTILVLEDDAANLRIFTALLWAKGHHVLEASTAKEAIEAALRNGRPDLLVSDVALKGEELSGTDVAAALLDRYGSLPTIFVTGTPLDLWDESDRRKLNAIRLRTTVAVLEKPFMPSAFEATVANLVREAYGSRAAPNRPTNGADAQASSESARR
jgi:CheY-like chemotaxis protein